MAQVNIHIDDELREKGERLFQELGLSFSAAISIFVSQVVRTRTLPFPVEAHETTNLTLASENALAKEWLSAEEDSAWANL